MATLNTTQRRQIVKGAALSAQIKALEKELGDIKSALSTALTDGVYTANGAELLISSSDRVTLDSAIVKGFLTPAQVLAASKTSHVTVLKFKTVAPASAVKAA